MPTEYSEATYKPSDYAESSYAATNYTDSGYESGADAKDNLIGKINLKDAKVAVIGLGIVGLPLAVEYALSGFRTVGIDTNESLMAALGRRESHVAAVPNDTLQNAINAGLTFHSKKPEDSDVDCLLLALPAFQDRKPEVNAIEDSLRPIMGMLKKEMLIMLESCRFPGTMGELVAEQIHSQTGLQPGIDIFIAFSPQSGDGPPVQQDLRERMKIVGGLTPLCREVAGTLCRRVFGSVQTHSIIPEPDDETSQQT